MTLPGYYQCCWSAGFQIDQHACWQAISSDCLPFSVQSLPGRIESEVILRQKKYPTARAAILSAILSQKTLILARADKCIGLTPREACGILNGTDYYGGTPKRHRKTACFEILVLEPHFAQSCGLFLLLIYCLLGWRTSLQRLKVLRMCWSSRGLPRLFLTPFNASSEK